MTSYRVELTRRAAKELRKVPPNVRVRIATALYLLGTNPHPPTAKTLSGRAGYFRVRVGDYRVVYTIENERLLVLVLTVGHRGDVYQNLP